MSKYRVRVLVTKFWRPGTDYSAEIVKAVQGKVRDGDFVVVSEKAISTASDNIVDEDSVEAGLSARFIARLWMPIVWGYFLSFLCHFRPELIHRLRDYPNEAGSRHKEVALERAGLLQALMFGSEGGIDGSNLAYSFVSLPLLRAADIAAEVCNRIMSGTGMHVAVMIVDTDKTYSWGNFHFAPRPRPIGGIHSFGGVIVYVLGRMFKLKRRATPIAVAGLRLPPENALVIADVANRARGTGAGKTVWDMAARFGVGLTAVSWEMLETVKHKPIVIVRKSER